MAFNYQGNTMFQQPAYMQPNQFMYGGGMTPQQTFYQHQQTQQTQPQGNNGFIINDFKIVSEDEAKAYIVNPNMRVMLLDRDKSVFYIKSADSLGTSTIEAFKYEKVTNAEKNAPAVEFNAEDFIKKSDFEKWQSDLNKQMEELRKSVRVKEILEGENAK